uniref:Si:ch211-194k22.8 n=1 Tax=Paramormyrops kingsleyae TaxID=1676925 RepID=A0A3B3R400_9TELE
MRRKTKAKRVLDREDDEDEEEEEGDPKRHANDHALQKRRKQMYPAKEKADGNSSSATGLQKLKMRESDYLQSCSKAELVTMVLCMQREMESLKEQIRCLTACGKLARNLEALIERTQVWSSGDAKTPSMPGGAVEGDTLMPALLNGQWVKQDASSLDHKPEPNENSQRNGLYSEFITPQLLERCNTGTTAQKLTNDLLRGLYERECLASHSISGIVYNKRGQPKPALPADEVQAILTVQYFFPGKTDAEIKGYIRQKLQNEAKRLRRKP